MVGKVYIINKLHTKTYIFQHFAWRVLILVDQRVSGKSFIGLTLLYEWTTKWA